MTGKTHLLIGLAASLIIADQSPQPLVFFLSVMAGSLAPDVDHPNSIAVRAFPPFRIFSLVFDHRGIFHSAIVPIILALMAHAYPSMQASLAGLSIGWALHLIADALTIRGIPALWPLTKAKMGLPIMNTGGLLEWILSSALVGFSCYYAYFIMKDYFNP